MLILIIVSLKCLAAGMDMLSGSQCLTNDLSPLAKLFSKTQLCYCDSFKVLIFVISMAILEISTIIAMNN